MILNKVKKMNFSRSEKMLRKFFVMMALFGSSFAYKNSIIVDPKKIINSMKLKLVDDMHHASVREKNPEISHLPSILLGKMFIPRKEVQFSEDEIKQLIDAGLVIEELFDEDDLSSHEGEKGQEDTLQLIIEEGMLGKCAALKGSDIDRQEEKSEKDTQNEDFLKIKNIQDILSFIENNPIPKCLKKKIRSIIKMRMENLLFKLKSHEKPEINENNQIKKSIVMLEIFIEDRDNSKLIKKHFLPNLNIMQEKDQKILRENFEEMQKFFDLEKILSELHEKHNDLELKIFAAHRSSPEREILNVELINNIANINIVEKKIQTFKNKILPNPDDTTNNKSDIAYVYESFNKIKALHDQSLELYFKGLQMKYIKCIWKDYFKN